MWFIGRPSKHPTNWKLIAYLLATLLTFNAANAFGGWLEAVLGNPQKIIVDLKSGGTVTGTEGRGSLGDVEITTHSGEVLRFQQDAVESLTVRYSGSAASLSWLRWGPLFAWCVVSSCSAIWLFYVRPKRLQITTS